MSYRKPLPSLEDYTLRLEAHQFGFLSRTLKEFVATQMAEHELMETAWEGGDAYMNKLMTYQQSSLYRFHMENMEVVVKHHREQVEALNFTGDPEFDAFMVRIRAHDWHYRLTDDHAVYIKGDNEQKSLEALVQAKGGIYLTVFQHWQRK